MAIPSEWAGPKVEWAGPPVEWAGPPVSPTLPYLRVLKNLLNATGTEEQQVFHGKVGTRAAGGGEVKTGEVEL